MARDIARQRERARAHMEMQQMASDMNQSRQEDKTRLRNNLADLLGRYATDGDENAVAWLNRIYGRMQVLSLAQLLNQIDVPSSLQIRAEVLQMAVDDVEQQRRSRGTYLLSMGGQFRTATPPGGLLEVRNATPSGLRYLQLPHDAYWYHDLDADSGSDDAGVPTFTSDFVFESPRQKNPTMAHTEWYSTTTGWERDEITSLNMDGSVSPGSRPPAKERRGQEERCELDAADDESTSPLSLAPPAWPDAQQEQNNIPSRESTSSIPAARQTNWHNAGVSPPSPGLRNAFRQSQGMQQQTEQRASDDSATYEGLYAHVLSTFDSLYGANDVRRRASVVDATDANAHWIANQLILRGLREQNEQRTTIVSSNPLGSWNSYPAPPTVNELVRQNIDLFYHDGEVPEETRRQTAPNFRAVNATVSQRRRRSSMVDTGLDLAMSRSAQRQTHGPSRRRSSVPEDPHTVAARRGDSLNEAKRRMSRLTEGLQGRLDSLT